MNIKGFPGIILIPPSLHHSGVSYQILYDWPIHRIESLSEVWTETKPPKNVQPKPAVWKNNHWSDVNNLVPIETLFSNLKSSDGGKGRWFVTNCPWHKDSHPSLRIDTERGICYCFSGCTSTVEMTTNGLKTREGLTPIGVYAKNRGISRSAAYWELATKLGI